MPPRHHERPPPGTAQLGLWVMLASLSVFFVAAIVAYLAVAGRAHAWPPVGAPRLPRGLWLATLLVLLASAAMHAALASIRAGDRRRLLAWLGGTAVLAAAFVVVQGANWLAFSRADTTFGEHLYSFGFYMLTGLHAGHVLGGLVVLGWVGVRAFRGHYTWARHAGVRLAAIYWDFLGAAWLVLFAVLRFAG